MRYLLPFFAFLPLWAIDANQPLLIENAGQFPPEVRFQILHGSQTFWITEDAIWLSAENETGGHRLQIDFEDAHAFDIRATGLTPAKVSYFLGDDPSQWHTGVPVYSGIKLHELYDGVDLALDINSGRLEWKWIVKQGATPPPPRTLRVTGADAVDSNAHSLRIRTGAGELTLNRPLAYDEAGRSIGGKSPNRENLSAVLLGSTFLAFTGATITRTAVDNAGAIYAVGTIDGVTNFVPTAGAFQTTAPTGRNAFLMKFYTGSLSNPLLLATFIGGSGNDEASDVFVDTDNSIVVAGATESDNFPTIFGAYRRTRQQSDAFVLRMAASGTTLVASTLWGGESREFGPRIARLGNGNIGIAGKTESGSLTCSLYGNEIYTSIRNGYVAILKRALNGFEVKKPLCTTDDLFLGAVRPRGTADAMVSGFATSRGGRISNAIGNSGVSGFFSTGEIGGQSTFSFSFVASLFADTGTAPRSCSLKDARIGDIAFTSTGNIAATGTTSSGSFPATSSVIKQFAEGSDAHVTVFTPSCSLQYATLFGGAGNDTGRSISLDAGDNVYLAGTTSSTNLPVTSGAISSSLSGTQDVFLALIKNNGRSLAYSTYFGTSSDDDAKDLFVQPDQTVTLFAGTGETGALPGLGLTAYQPIRTAGASNNFVARLRIDNPGTVSGYAFQDYNLNGNPDISELPLAGFFVFDDRDNNGVLGAGEPFTAASSFVAFFPPTNVPFIPGPNYNLGNLPVGPHRICGSFAPTAPGTSTCRNVTVEFGGITRNVNFGLLPGQVGVSSLSPATGTVRAGETVAFDLDWTHPASGWRVMKDWILRFVSDTGDEALQLKYVEATNKFSVFNPSSGMFGPEFFPGDNAKLETNMAQLHLDASVAPTIPGRSARWRLAITFKPKAAGQSFRPMFYISTDSGLEQGYEPLGSISVVK